MFGFEPHTMPYGGFLKRRFPKMDGFKWKIRLEWMIWGTPILGKLHIATFIHRHEPIEINAPELLLKYGCYHLKN